MEFSPLAEMNDMRFQPFVIHRPTAARLCLAVSLASLFVADLAAAQNPGPLADLTGKATLADADKSRIQTRAKELADALAQVDAKPGATDKEREQARRKLIEELKQGQDAGAFRAEAAAAAAKALERRATEPPAFDAKGVVTNFYTAHEAMLALIELDHAVTRPTLAAALASQFAAVRYQAARGLRDLQPKLTDPAVCKRLISDELTTAGRTETNPLVLRMIYQALDFPERQKGFRGNDDIASALGDILTGHLDLAASAGPRADLPGIQLAARIGKSLTKPCVPLATALTRMLVNAVQDGDADLADEIERALHEVIEPQTGEAKRIPRIAPLLRGKPDQAKIDAALNALIGPADHPGVMNRAPWRMPAK